MADLVTSLHRLLRARDRVRWDWLPLAAALLAVLAVLEFWWVFFQQQEMELGGRVATLMGAGWEAGDWLVSVLPNAVVLASFVALALSGRRWLHTAVVLLWLVVFNVSWWRLTLG